ncbi:MAG: hypothetical protein WDW36_005058 [Sanguina aurantia]
MEDEDFDSVCVSVRDESSVPLLQGEAGFQETGGSSRPAPLSFRRLLVFAGPGLLMSIAYLDPGNLESALQVGCQTGYSLLWLLAASIAMGFIVQMQAAKLGVVTGKHLAQHCREQYSMGPRMALWLMAEVALIGSDVQEVVGSAIGLRLLSRGAIPLWGGVLLSAGNSFALLLVERLGVRWLEGMFGGLIAMMGATFGYMFFSAGVPLGEVAEGFLVPRLSRSSLPAAVALMGSLIMPHNIYLHSALVQTRRLATRSDAAKKEALTYFGVESAASLLGAVFINVFVVGVFAKGFFGTEEASNIGLQSAGEYLGNRFGGPVVTIWALGLLAAGLSSTMTGTYTGQFLMGGFLKLRVSPWTRILLTRSVAILPTLAVAIAYRDSSTSLDTLNQSLNLLQSVQLPFALIPVLSFTSSKVIVGTFADSLTTRIVTRSIAAIFMAINIGALLQRERSSSDAAPDTINPSKRVLYNEELDAPDEATAVGWISACRCQSKLKVHVEKLQRESYAQLPIHESAYPRSSTATHSNASTPGSAYSEQQYHRTVASTSRTAGGTQAALDVVSVVEVAAVQAMQQQ